MLAERPNLGRLKLAAIYIVGVAPIFLLPLHWFVKGYAYYLLVTMVILWAAVAGFAVWAARRRWPLALTLGPLAAVWFLALIDIQQYVVHGQFMFF